MKMRLPCSSREFGIVLLAGMAAASLATWLLAGGLLSLRRQAQPRKDKSLREHLSETQIDKMVMDSFPASDPPSTY